MTVASTTSEPIVLRMVKPAAVLALLISLAALGALAAGPVGFRVGWLSYRVGLGTLLPWSFFWGAGGAVLGAIALILGLAAQPRRGLALSLAAIVVGLGTAAVPWHFNELRGRYPSIDDISTDTANPPQFVAAVPLRAAEDGNTAAYQGAVIAAQQQKAYPDLAPVTLPVDPAKGFEAAKAAAAKLGWTIDATDPAGGRIEAYDRSRWFGFTDVIVIRVAAADGGGSRIDVRSASRHGRGDFGVNATRIRAYLAALKGDGK